MSWVVGAFGNAILSGFVNVVDSHLITKRMPSLQAYMLPTAVMYLCFGAIFTGFFPLPSGIGTIHWLVAIGSGLAAALGIVLMLLTFRTGEVSRIVPVVHTFPVFVAMLAIPLLHETLSLLQWLAVFMTVAGAVLISARRGTAGKGAQLSKSFALLLGSSLLIAVSNTASKYALGYLSFWNMYTINAFSFGAVFALISLRPDTVRQLRDMEERRWPLGLLALNELLVIPSVLVAYWAIQNGPVSLVSTVIATRPFFVFVYTSALASISPAILSERLTRGTIGVKMVSIGLITGGIAIINLR